jgi:hypothetical protein
MKPTAPYIGSHNVNQRFVENTIGSTIKLSTRIFKRFMLNPALPPSANPFGRGYPRRIGQIHRNYTVVGANGTTMVMMFVGGVVFVSTALSVLFLQ